MINQFLVIAQLIIYFPIKRQLKIRLQFE